MSIEYAEVKVCGDCGLAYREGRLPHKCAEWTKGRKPMAVEYAEDKELFNEQYAAGCVVLHVTGASGDVEVWLNRGTHNYDGLAIGGGESRKQAIEDAIATLEKALSVLKEKVNAA